MSMGPIRVGVIDPAGAATPLLANASAIPFTALPVTVRLTRPFAQEMPVGWPAPPHQVGSAPGTLHFAKGHVTNAILTTHACVAAALIAAGAAVKV